jgi:hypothetical protein
MEYYTTFEITFEYGQYSSQKMARNGTRYKGYANCNNSGAFNPFCLTTSKICERHIKCVMMDTKKQASLFAG